MPQRMFRTHRRGRRPRRPLRWIIAGAGMDVPVRPDRQRPRHPRSARFASTTQRMQSRGHSPRTISYGRPRWSVIPRREGVEALPYGCGEGIRLSPAPPSTPQSRREAPRQLPFQGSREGGVRAHPRYPFTLAARNPSVTALCAVTAPLAGEPRRDAVRRRCPLTAAVSPSVTRYAVLRPIGRRGWRGGGG